MAHEPIVVIAYDPAWPAEFEAERKLLTDALRSSAIIEHIGSTSVPGLAAKPVIDMLVGVAGLAEIEARIPELEALSYQYVLEFESVTPERRYFRKMEGSAMTHQIHAVVVGGEFWVRHLAFRDYLRSHPDTAREYAQLKTELAARHRLEREAYTDAKGPFIRRVEEKAMNEGRS